MLDRFQEKECRRKLAGRRRRGGGGRGWAVYARRNSASLDLEVLMRLGVVLFGLRPLPAEAFPQSL
jgi:hypothetical protein